jgi:hypothetical protein
LSLRRVARNLVSKPAFFRRYAAPNLRRSNDGLTPCTYFSALAASCRRNGGNRTSTRNNRSAIRLATLPCQRGICLAGSMAAGFGVPALAGQSLPTLGWPGDSSPRPEHRTLCRLKAGLQTFHRSLARAKHVPSGTLAARCEWLPASYGYSVAAPRLFAAALKR